jgi:hypothetical protein
MRQPVYMTAALGVIYDVGKERKQIIFGGGETKRSGRKQNDESIVAHTDDITCLAMNSTRTLVATGQVGNIPLIFIWDSVSAKLMGSLKLPRGSRAVTAISFNVASDLIACADFSNDHNVYCFDWKMN